MAPAGVIALTMLTAALLSSGGGGSHAAAEQEEEAGMPRWVEPRLRRLVGTRRHKIDADSEIDEVASWLATQQEEEENEEVAEEIPRQSPSEVQRINPEGDSTVAALPGVDLTGVPTYLGRPWKNHSHVVFMNCLLEGIIHPAGVGGSGFMARDLTIKNTTGVDAGPAVALMIMADRSICYRCEIDGYQDTLNAECNRQFYHTCNISGTVDFVFGCAKDVFQQCNLLVRLPMADGHCVITAQGRDAPNDHSGFVFQDSTVAALPGVDLTGVPTYLGRPWKNHSHVVFMNCLLDGIIHPAGWERWGDKDWTPYSTGNSRIGGTAPTPKGASSGQDSTSSRMLRRRRISPVGV
nr:probable pectinesterase/pectinesterase inhibitor 6 [Setaria viridis]